MNSIIEDGKILCALRNMLTGWFLRGKSLCRRAERVHIRMDSASSPHQKSLANHRLRAKNDAVTSTTSSVIFSRLASSSALSLPCVLLSPVSA